jgi:two-component system chemotaxis sensor kinase CheA
MKVSDYKALYISEADEILQALENGIIGLEGEEDKKACIEELFRNAHNLKGISGAMGYDFVVEASHSLENVLDGFRQERSEVQPHETDRLLHSVDLLRELVRRSVEGAGQADEEELLSDIKRNLEPIFGEPEKLIIIDDTKGNISEETREIAKSAKEQAGSSRKTAKRSAAAKKKRNSDGAGIETSKEDIGEMMPEAAGVEEAQEADREDASALADAHQESPAQMIRSTRVELERLDLLVDLVGELIISRIRLNRLAREIKSRPLFDELAASTRLISQIQAEIMEVRLIPVGQVLQRFKRLVRDISKEMGKQVKLEIIGAEIGLDKVVLESMVDPLVHVIRNAVDHGIESPGQRAELGKPEIATITISARRERNSVIIDVSDDGRGIDFEKICREGATEGQPVHSQKDLTEDELCQILTTPGFSTSDKVDRLSGRGMGMNIVKNVVDSLGGAMHINSDFGRGTTISLHLPINLSIIKALLFFVGEDVHAMPIEYIRETTRVERGLFKSLGGRTVMMTKNEAIPIYRPSEIFGLEPESENERYVKVIVVDTENGSLGLVVNRILGQQDVVIKGLPRILKEISGVSGATILGSGKIAFIWDPRFLFEGRYTYESVQ